MEDTAMKRKYMKPSMKVYELHNKACLLVGSGSDRSVPLWNGEGN